MGLFRCRHKWGKVEGAHQYCSKCGEARVVPCAHKYKLASTYTKTWTSTGKVTAFIRIYECELCGLVAEKRVRP